MNDDLVNAEIVLGLLEPIGDCGDKARIVEQMDAAIKALVSIANAHGFRRTLSTLADARCILEQEGEI